MIKVSNSSPSLRDTPFTSQKGINYFAEKGIEIAAPDDADLIVGGTFKSLLKAIARYGRHKKYLLWTIEPRFSKHFQHKVNYLLLPTIHVMNIYTGIWKNNHFFVPKNTNEVKLEKFSSFKNKKIVAIMTCQAGAQWRFFYKGVDIDLCNLRTEIALAGYDAGIVDIYGRHWPDSVKTLEQSRGQGWRDRKNTILQNYHFHLCFENTNWPYYCTEKIWDSIQGGCLPIYYGKNNKIYEDFPRNSFLDYSEFNNPQLLFDYIYSMSVDEFQERMSLCVKTLNRVTKAKQATSPNQKILDQTLLKIREICGLRKSRLVSAN